MPKVPCAIQAARLGVPSGFSVSTGTAANAPAVTIQRKKPAKTDCSLFTEVSILARVECASSNSTTVRSTNGRAFCTMQGRNLREGAALTSGVALQHLAFELRAQAE